MKANDNMMIITTFRPMWDNMMQKLLWVGTCLFDGSLKTFQFELLSSAPIEAGHFIEETVQVEDHLLLEDLWRAYSMVEGLELRRDASYTYWHSGATFSMALSATKGRDLVEFFAKAVSLAKHRRLTYPFSFTSDGYLTTISRMTDYDKVVRSPPGGVSKGVGVLVSMDAHGVQATCVLYVRDHFIAHTLVKFAPAGGITQLGVIKEAWSMTRLFH